jgi:hypothetical protein
VQPVGADDQVDGPGRAPFEGHLGAVVTLGDVGDGVAEDVFDVVSGDGVEDAGQVAAEDLELGDRPPESPSRSAGRRASCRLASST